MEKFAIQDKGMWRYLEKWRKIFPDALSVCWHGTWMENDYCRNCRFCCGPQDSPEPFPMALLPGQIGPDVKNDFYMLNNNTAYLGARGCKADTETGCRLPLEKRPVACGLFPLVLANGGFWLYQNCPAVLFVPLAQFMDMAREAAKMLLALDERDIRHISLNLPQATLAASYIDMRVKVFDENGLCPLLK